MNWNKYLFDENEKPLDRLTEAGYSHGHRNPSGYILTAQIIDSYIDYIVRHNPQDFKNVGFIGTNIKF